MKITVTKPTKSEIEDAKSWPVWEKEVSEFDWEYAEKETCLILDGEATVASKDGAEMVAFGAGDMVIFEEGLACTWKITKPIKKHYRFG